MSAPVAEQGEEVFEEAPSPRWPWLAGTLLSVLGLGASIYLTYEHYTGSKSLTCPAASSHGIFNCYAVTTSRWSMWYGIPVAVLGLVYFVVMLGLQSPWAWWSPRLAVRAGRIGWCLIGLASALRLVYYEIYRIDQICEWCTTVHIITFLIFVVTVFGTVSTTPAGDPTDYSPD